MNNTNKTPLQKALDNLITEMKKEAGAHDENEFDQLLAEQLGPALTEDDQLFDTSVFVFLKVAAYLYQPVSEQKKLNVQSALDKVTDKNLLEYVNCAHAVKDFILDKEPAVTNDVDKRYKWNKALRSALKLEDYANGEMYHRIQGYSNDIQKLKEESE